MVRQHPSKEELEKTLGAPIGFGISDTAMKLRRNLLLTSVVIIILVAGEIQPGADFSLLGVKLTGVTPFKLMVGLAVMLGYNLIHYVWCCYEFYSEWAIRITGTKLGFVTGAKWASEGADYPDDPKQSSLYTWWLQEARSIGAYRELLVKVEDGLRSLNGHVDELQAKDMSAAGTVSRSIQEVKSSLDQIQSSVESSEGVILSTRIPVSLERFDNRFRLLLKSQNIRIVLIEIGLPLAVSAFSIVYLIRFFFDQQ